MSFFVLSICTAELISAPTIITLLPNPLPSNNEKLPLASNAVPYPENSYLLRSAFAVNLNVPNKESSSI